MPAFIRGQVVGAKVASDNLLALGRTVAGKVTRKAVNAGSKLIFDEVKQRAPKESGLYRKSIGRVIRTYRNSGTTLAVIGPRTKPSFRKEVKVKKDRVYRQMGAKTFKVNKPTAEQQRQIRNPRFYQHLVEKGTKRGRKGFNVLGGAFQSKGEQARSTMVKVLEIETAAEAQKLAAKAAVKATRKS